MRNARRCLEAVVESIDSGPSITAVDSFLTDGSDESPHASRADNHADAQSLPDTPWHIATKWDGDPQFLQSPAGFRSL